MRLAGLRDHADDLGEPRQRRKRPPSLGDGPGALEGTVGCPIPGHDRALEFPSPSEALAEPQYAEGLAASRRVRKRSAAS